MRSGNLSHSRAATQKGRMRTRSCGHSFLSHFMIFAFRFELQEPADAFVQHAGIERVDDELTALFGKNEVSLAEQIEMVRDGGLADLEVLGDRAGGQVPGPEKFENLPAGRIVQCFEDEVHVFVFRQISKYSAG